MSSGNRGELRCVFKELPTGFQPEHGGIAISGMVPHQIRPATEDFLAFLRLNGYIQPTFTSQGRMDYRTLVKHAQAARKHSHSPYSGFRVGAALLTSDGKVFRGCNIEISSFGLTICAERTAIFKAISEGKKKFKAIAIATDQHDFTPPCGACRQVLMDLAGDIDFIMSTKRGAMKIVKMFDLLPHPFGDKNLLKD